MHRFARQILQALDYAHQSSVIHNDKHVKIRIKKVTKNVRDI